MNAAGDITYSKGQLQNATERPAVNGPELWHVHYYTHADHRTTWDISAGKVVACYEQSWGKLTRSTHLGWRYTNTTGWPVPITL